MLKLRLKRNGRKKAPFYRLVIMENRSRRDGKPIDSLGYYNPLTKQISCKIFKLKKWLLVGARPTKTVLQLLKKNKIL